MKTKKTRFKLKKIPYYALLILLTGGASSILGFLSFSGMFALWPILPLAIAALILSVIYEGEIYLQNIKGAFKKLFQSNYLKYHLAKEFLLKHVEVALDDSACPQFFIDYKRQLELLHVFGHKELDEESKKTKKRIERVLKDMEKWFTHQLFSKKKKIKAEESAYVHELQAWLKKHDKKEWKSRLGRRIHKYQLIKAFSLVAGIFMGIGTTYLLTEAFAIIPLLAAVPAPILPIIIVPLSLIAGAAYGMLTLNALTDMVNNNTIVKWYNKLKEELSKGFTVRNVILTLSAIILVGLAIVLTICTAGTWWTIANKVKPIFEWMKKIPDFVMGIINPIIIGCSSLIFIFQNTAESLDLIDIGLDWAEETIKEKTFWQKIFEPTKEAFQRLVATEHWLQIINPFRWLLKLLITPLRILLFLGHLVSVAATADQMPGVPQIVAAIIAIICEGVTDAPYFIDSDSDSDMDKEEHDLSAMLEHRLGSEEEGHDHGNDIPTMILRALAAPFYALAALWDFITSRLNTTPSDENAPKKPVLTFKQAWDKQRGNKEIQQVTLPKGAKHPSKNWQIEHTVTRIEKHEQHLQEVIIDQPLADKKIEQLHQLKNNVRAIEPDKSLEDLLNAALTVPEYNTHRLFSCSKENTKTQDFIEGLQERVCICA